MRKQRCGMITSRMGEIMWYYNENWQWRPGSGQLRLAICDTIEKKTQYILIFFCFFYFISCILCSFDIFLLFFLHYISFSIPCFFLLNHFRIKKKKREKESDIDFRKVKNVKSMDFFSLSLCWMSGIKSLL